MLIAVTKDANNYILPVAYAIVDEETVESWSWFLQQFRMHIANRSMRPLCVISDRHKGIINAMENLEEWKEPHAYHRFCLRHVRSKFMRKFKGVSLKRLCWSIGSTSQGRKYRWSIREMRSIDQKAWDYLHAIEGSKWIVYHDEGHRRWGNLTKNSFESFNNALRGARMLSIKACIEYTFNKAIQQFQKHTEIARSCITALPPRVWDTYTERELHAQGHTVVEFNYDKGEYKVTSRLHANEHSGNDYTVEYRRKKCTCRKWQMQRFPCSQAIAVCHYTGEIFFATLTCITWYTIYNIV
ncbi:uncharacterized protein LOC143591788 [Bidens hawaiensis]|uniref:uncharacterized protein LOC143591788 n=1 Tax=Bidens hawaiensis TaxID=980011 RepID=UPI00404AE45A